MMLSDVLDCVKLKHDWWVLNLFHLFLSGSPSCWISLNGKCCWPLQPTQTSPSFLSLAHTEESAKTQHRGQNVTADYRQMIRLLQSFLPSLASCHSSNATVKAWATVKATAWAWAKGNSTVTAICTIRSTKMLNYNHKTSHLCIPNLISLSPCPFWCCIYSNLLLSSLSRGKHGTPVSRWGCFELYKRTLYHAACPLCNRIFCRPEVTMFRLNHVPQITF